jgi:DNA-directed RNA polymerase specialized sigma24 family protein
MSSIGSVTHWINQLTRGDHAAAQPLWERYFLRLVGLARKKLQGTPRRAADEEDVALSAFDSFCRAAGRGRFPQLSDRDDLWRLLVIITARKAADLIHGGLRAKRGGGKVLDEAAAGPGFDQAAGGEPTPEFAAQVAEECRRLLDSLGNDDLRKIALWKMEGYTDEEIAAGLQYVPRTVRRKVRQIRSLWAKELGP